MGKTARPKIIDCFPFFNELELLELRLMELNETVDYFVIVEANKTHAGNAKEFIFEKNKKRFKPYLDKIIYVKVTDLPDPAPPLNAWLPENFQRNAISRGLEQVAVKGDKILVSDLDEIPNTSAIIENLASPGWVIFKQSLYYYYVNCRVSRNWGGTVMATYGTFLLPQDLRKSAIRHGVGVYPNGGWHYSYLVGNSPDRIFYKAKNGADQNPNYPIGTVEDIAERVKNLKDLLGRTSRFNQLRIIDINDDKPASMDKFLKKYPEFFYREKS
jgi:beta-1,4-mannosyl-glycoprotein beta-1,4-N-acetylglucosaminyltransferase